MMPLQAWNKTDFYDPSTGDMAVRYAGFSGHGEYWLKLPATPGGKSRRQQREWALTLIEEAIEAGNLPGEVAYREPPPPSAISQF
jgi:hypothetical protein